MINSYNSINRKRKMEEIIVFDKPHYRELDEVRMQHLNLLNFNFSGKTLLDVGCGVGAFSNYWAKKGCDVFGIDALENNIEVMKER